MKLPLIQLGSLYWSWWNYFLENQYLSFARTSNITFTNSCLRAFWATHGSGSFEQTPISGSFEQTHTSGSFEHHLLGGDLLPHNKWWRGRCFGGGGEKKRLRKDSSHGRSWEKLQAGDFSKIKCYFFRYFHKIQFEHQVNVREFQMFTNILPQLQSHLDANCEGKL